MADNKKENVVPTEKLATNANALIVGKGVRIKGDINNCELLKLEGIIEGTVEDIANISIEKDGVFDGTAVVGYANVSGSLKGNITVKDRLTITSTGQVEGKIIYGSLEVGRGGTLNGKVKRTSIFSSGLKSNI